MFNTTTVENNLKVTIPAIGGAIQKEESNENRIITIVKLDINGFALERLLSPTPMLRISQEPIGREFTERYVPCVVKEVNIVGDTVLVTVSYNKKSPALEVDVCYWDIGWNLDEVGHEISEAYRKIEELI